MISFDFEYYRPSSIDETVNTYNTLKSQGKAAIYYAGGTEIISMARMNSISFDAVIDIKEIPECNVLRIENNRLVVGAAVTLTKICEADLFPLLTKAARAGADHTSRDKITLGGNICGRVPYREALLPFLLCDSEAVLAGINGIRIVPLMKVYKQRLQMENGEFLTRIITDTGYLNLPHEYLRRTKMEKIDYPLVSLALIKRDGAFRAAFSGVCSFPFRSMEMEQELNRRNTPLDVRINSAVGQLPGALLNDMQGSAEYREFVLKNMLGDSLARVGGIQ